MTDLNQKIEKIRGFNRFYTKQIGVLNESLLKSRFSLTEGRVVYELANSDKTTATSLAGKLGLDPGYLSRLLKKFERDQLVERKSSNTDKRSTLLTLTKKGRAEFRVIDANSKRQFGSLLEDISSVNRERLIESMEIIRSILEPSDARQISYVLRYPKAGDMGWVVKRHGELYTQEFGWDEQFEALVAGIVSEYVKNCEPKRERCWIAEKDGKNVGAVFLVRDTKKVAKLRLLIVEPSARGLGIGSRLVEECTSFAREVGYKKITLWTNHVLHAARHIYKKAGYKVTNKKRHRSFGKDLVGETWELDL